VANDSNGLSERWARRKTMSITYTNRKGDAYHLHEGTTKKGNPKYYFAKKEPDTPVETIPDGYEIYENPNAQVFLRRIPPKIIRDEELAVVQQGVKAYAQVKHTILDVRKNAIIIYTAEPATDLFSELFSLFNAPRQQIEDLLTQHLQYTAMMRFTLTDKETRDFTVQRFCFLGSIDDWIYIDGPAPLADLVQEYVPHLGQESFYELH
jgi:hypothetical protein